MDWVEEANMADERADTWKRAEDMVANGSAGQGPYVPKADGTLDGEVTDGDHMAPLETVHPDLEPTLDAPAVPENDDAVRDLAGQEGEAGLAKRSTSERTRMLRGLVSGATLDDDEATIQGILRASVAAGDVVTVIDGASAWDLAYATDGGEFQELLRFFRAHYYPATASATALMLICRCLEGETAEWEQEMVADLLCGRSDGAALVAKLGEHYEKGGFAEGLDKLEWQLGGGDQARIEARFGTSWAARTVGAPQ